MGILARFTDIMESNINALLDKCEDPSKMIDQSLRKLNEELAQVKNETAAVMAEEKSAARRVEELQKAIDKYDASARKAVVAGNDNDARSLLAKKQELESQKVTADNTYTVAHANAEKMRQMYNKLTSDINTLNSRSDTIKAQVSMAKAQDRVTDISAKIGKTGASDTFSRMEQKAQRMLDESTARAELSQTELEGDPADVLAAKYAADTSASVEDELAKLKAELNGAPTETSGTAE
jgi:phage shock protein A